MHMHSFTDEFLKIASLPGKALAFAKKSPVAVAVPATVLGSVLGWEKLKQLKRRHDIGKAYDEQMVARSK